MSAVKELPGKQHEIDAGKEAVLAAYNSMVEAKSHFKLAAEAAGLDLKQDALEQLLKGKAKAEDLGHEASRFVQEKPLATMGLAFLAGFLISQLFSRK